MPEVGFELLHYCREVLSSPKSLDESVPGPQLIPTPDPQPSYPASTACLVLRQLVKGDPDRPRMGWDVWPWGRPGCGTEGLRDTGSLLDSVRNGRALGACPKRSKTRKDNEVDHLKCPASRADGVAQVVQCLCSKCEVVSSRPSAAKKNKKKKGERCLGWQNCSRSTPPALQAQGLEFKSQC
jgi:hypothetical protein